MPLHGSECYGGMIGRNPQMRALFAQLDAIASTDATVLIEGETGTGKELMAEEIHRGSPRHDNALIVVDCGAIPEHLVESELFGHVRGSFTGASADRAGRLRAGPQRDALPGRDRGAAPAAQPKLLRALENRQIKPVGSDRYRRPTCASSPPPTATCARRSTRAHSAPDLFYRLSVMRLRPPAAARAARGHRAAGREFMADFWRTSPPARPPPPLSPETLQRLVTTAGRGTSASCATSSSAWRCSRARPVRRQPVPEPDPSAAAVAREGPAVPGPALQGGQDEVDRSFEIAYVTELLRRNDGNVAAAARRPAWTAPTSSG